MALAAPMIKKSKKKRAQRISWSKERETQYKGLVEELLALGFIVRREELKRGHCWKAISGTCRSLAQKFIFVDSRLSADEQVAFLVAQKADAAVEQVS